MPAATIGSGVNFIPVPFSGTEATAVKCRCYSTPVQLLALTPRLPITQPQVTERNVQNTSETRVMRLVTRPITTWMVE